MAAVWSVGYTRPCFKCDNEGGMVTVCLVGVVRITQLSSMQLNSGHHAK